MVRALAAALFVLSAALCLGQVPETQQILAGEPQGSLGFGFSTSIKGDLAAIGAANSTVSVDGIDYPVAGAVEIYRRVNGVWTFEARVHASDPKPYVWFGFDVAVSPSPHGDMLVTSAIFWGPTASDLFGAVYVFRKVGSQWVEEQRITEPVTQTISFFGGSVAAGPDVFAVSDPVDEEGVQNGAVYVYRFNGSSWALEAGPLVPPGVGSTIRQAGEEIALYANPTTELLLVSVAGSAQAGHRTGAAFIYRNVIGTWVLDTPTGLSMPDLVSLDSFGLGLSIDGNVAAIAAPGRDIGAVANAGSVYVFRYDGAAWQHEQTLDNPEPHPSDVFGRELIVSGDQVVVGVPFADASTGHAFAYRFDGSTWGDVRKLVPSDPMVGASFGTIAFDGAWAIIGAVDSSPGGIARAGSAYAYLLANSPTGSNVVVQPVDPQTGASPATLTFSNVTSPGTTEIETLTSGPALPGEFKLGTPPALYELSTTASYAGTILLTLRWDEGAYNNEGNLKLLHYENGAWVNVTTSLDTAANVITGSVTSLSPFVIAEEEAAVSVRIDIKPNDYPNTVNLGSNGVVPVAVFSTTDFDARQIDPTSVRLADSAVRVRGNGTPMASFEDVNGDGLLDLVVQVSTVGLQLTDSDAQAILTGRTFAGQEIRGSDTVRVVP